jgi:hypothetical protein
LTGFISSDNRSAAHGSKFGLGHASQKVTLWRVEPSNPLSAWLIQSKVDAYLEMIRGERFHEVKMNYDRRVDHDKASQEWWIGRDEGEGIL